MGGRGLADRMPRAMLQRKRASACVASARRRDSPRCTAPCMTSRKSRSKASTASNPRPAAPAGERTRRNHRGIERPRMVGSVDTLGTVVGVRSDAGGRWNMDGSAMDLLLRELAHPMIHRLEAMRAPLSVLRPTLAKRPAWVGNRNSGWMPSHRMRTFRRRSRLRLTLGSHGCTISCHSFVPPVCASRPV